ncbi:MAG: hypothetical protein VXZ69_03905, partial [Pseudomonadota bacterium]|nr:hypothetical protein [Pseudomonadota bacterium]
PTTGLGIKMYRKYVEARQSELPGGDFRFDARSRKRAAQFSSFDLSPPIVLQDFRLFTNQSQKLATDKHSDLKFLNVRCVK